MNAVLGARLTCPIHEVCLFVGEAPAPIAVKRAAAVGVIASRLRFDSYDAWAGTSDRERRRFARRVLFARLRLNRAGLLRWRVIRRKGGDDGR